MYLKVTFFHNLKRRYFLLLCRRDHLLAPCSDGSVATNSRRRASSYDQTS